jgi:CBS domain-containing protein
MLVSERMTRDPVVIHDDTPIDEAMKIMRDNKVRRQASSRRRTCCSHRLRRPHP